MAEEKRFYVYIMSSLSRRIYTGVTNNLFRRVMQHKSGEFRGFTQRYCMNRLVYYECFQYVNNAIRREKQVKGLDRAKRVALIERDNPTWDDLAGEWGKPWEPLRPEVAPTRADPSPAARARDDKSKLAG